MVGIVKDPLYLEHVADEYRPGNPQRLAHTHAMLPSIDSGGVLCVPPRMATHEEIAYIHDGEYVERIAATKGHHARLDPDTAASPRTHGEALLAVGDCLTLADSLLSGAASS